MVGYSGHEYDLEPTVIAIALGAKVVERHKRPKDIDMILGDGVKKLTRKEITNRKKLCGY